MSHQVSAYVEHIAVECEASASQTRCFDPGHWRVRIDDRPVGDRAELRACLRELAHRFPEQDSGAQFSSRAELTLRPEHDASYDLVQQVIQLAVAEGIYHVSFATASPPPAGPARPGGVAAGDSRERRMAGWWAEVGG